MKTDSIQLLCDPADIHDYVMSLWSDGPIRRSHQYGGAVHDVVDRFARLPRIFFEPSDIRHEWTHFSAWWGAILLCEYDNPSIRGLRYLHEMYHAATLPHIPGLCQGAMMARSFQNEREASTFTEMAIYLDLPDLRPLTFPHPIFADRIIFPEGDLTRPDRRLVERWRDERERKTVLEELMYARLAVVLAEPHEVDETDPQVIWLRRYGEQGAAWAEVWSKRHDIVDRAMIDLRERCRTEGARSAGQRHLDWLLSKDITDGTDVPFHQEAVAFRTTFDNLITAYDRAMAERDQQSVRHSADA